MGQTCSFSTLNPLSFSRQALLLKLEIDSFITSLYPNDNALLVPNLDPTQALNPLSFSQQALLLKLEIDSFLTSSLYPNGNVLVNVPLVRNFDPTQSVMSRSGVVPSNPQFYFPTGFCVANKPKYVHKDNQISGILFLLNIRWDAYFLQ